MNGKGGKWAPHTCAKADKGDDSMKVAVIDIGSNSVRLLLGDYDKGKLTVEERSLITTRLGRGVAEDSMLDEPSMRDTLSALKHFKGKAESLGCQRIMAFATSAVREAKNGGDFLHIIKEETDMNVEIISGAREAALSFKGARAGLGIHGPSLVVDIGGGSTELCLGDDKSFETVSFPMGAVRFTKKYLVSDPPTDREILTASLEIEKMISAFGVCLKKYNRSIDGHPLRAIGVGGTITTLAAVKQSLAVYDSKRVHGFNLKMEDVEQIFNRLRGLTVEEKRSIPGLMPQRADIIAAGVLILLGIMKNLKLSIIKVSESDLMEGYIIEKLSREVI